MGQANSTLPRQNLDSLEANMMELRDVLHRLRMSEATLYRRIRKGEAPPPKKHLNRSLWRRDEVEAYREMLLADFQPKPSQTPK